MREMIAVNYPSLPGRAERGKAKPRREEVRHVI
jgi:hypothetical protein